jgi:hypothetical protein
MAHTASPEWRAAHCSGHDAYTLVQRERIIM